MNNLYSEIKGLIVESVTFENAVLDSYNHFIQDLGKTPSISDIIEDLKNYDISNIPEESSIDNTPEDSANTYESIKFILKDKELINEAENNKDIDSMSLKEIKSEIKKVKAELDYWDRRDKVCLTFGADAERYELEQRLQKLENKLESFDENLVESSLNSSIYTDVIKSINDACAEEIDEKEIQKFLQNIIGYCKDIAESYDILVELEEVK